MFIMISNDKQVVTPVNNSEKKQVLTLVFLVFLEFYNKNTFLYC